MRIMIIFHFYYSECNYSCLPPLKHDLGNDSCTNLYSDINSPKKSDECN